MAAATPTTTPPHIAPQSTPAKTPAGKRRPRFRDPETTALRKRCRTYLDETHYSEWNFVNFWGGDEAVHVQCRDMWLRELLRIANTDKNPDRSEAAIVVRNRHKQVSQPHSSRSRQVSKSKGSSKGRACDRNPDVSEPPPPYEPSSQEETTHDAKPLNLHEQQHEVLSADQKWNLPGGRSVEDILFSWVVSQSDEARRLGQVPRESYAHSYILDVDDPTIKALFEMKEWDVIVSRLLPLPTVDDSLATFMYKFANVKTTTELRRLLITTPYLSPEETYTLDKNGDRVWVHSALTSLVILYEHGHMLSTDNLEAWFQINIWGPIFDRCFQHIPNIFIKRTESQSPSNSDRKNSTTITSGRKNIGNRYDGLIIHNRIEYGAIEDSKEYQYKKWTSDSLKLAKLLHDQMRGLEVEVRHVREALEGFVCVGFLTAGLRCRGMFLQYGKGHVCLLQRSDEYVVPEIVSPLSKLIAVLVGVWQMREVVKGSVNNLAEFLANTQMMFHAAMGQAERLPAILPTCFDTDAEL